PPNPPKEEEPNYADANSILRLASESENINSTYEHIPKLKEPEPATVGARDIYENLRDVTNKANEYRQQQQQQQQLLKQNHSLRPIPNFDDTTISKPAAPKQNLAKHNYSLQPFPAILQQQE